MPAYVVFTDNTLIAIAETLPTDDAALVAIPGIGARKLEQFGPDVLELVRQRPKPPRIAKIVPKALVRKSLVGLACYRLASIAARTGRTMRRNSDAKGGAIIMTNSTTFSGVGIDGMSWTLHVAGTATAAAHSAASAHHAVPRPGAAPPPRPSRP